MESVTNRDIAQLAVEFSDDWIRSNAGNFRKPIPHGNLSVVYRPEIGWGWNIYIDQKAQFPRFRGEYDMAIEAGWEAVQWWKEQEEF